MRVKLHRCLRTATVTAVLFILAFGLVQTGQAQGISYGDTIPEGKVVENDVILIGDDVVVD